ncbi:hypothetical protein RchiOBHm_Chr5g0057681 [Rosa chinensis]|uniref:Uncharacterized protein n=1 Tax=Rosa chinensis TaxID=74649 RepID=A0A2P6QGY8_ROSCH|nr:hypothetical protein RchiOBHm_Chr5g0057681 [Rosa chinensis]
MEGFVTHLLKQKLALSSRGPRWQSSAFAAAPFLFVPFLPLFSLFPGMFRLYHSTIQSLF